MKSDDTDRQDEHTKGPTPGPWREDRDRLLTACRTALALLDDLPLETLATFDEEATVKGMLREAIARAEEREGGATQ